MTMRIITINLPEKYIGAIQSLNEKGIYPSRSEAIRIALREFLNEELKMDQDLEKDAFNFIINHDHSENTIEKEEPLEDLIEESPEEPEKKIKDPIVIHDEKNKTSTKRYIINEQKQTDKPETLYKLFPKDIYLNLIVSYLKESPDPLTPKDIAIKLGLSNSYAAILMKDLIEKKSDLLTIKKEGYNRFFSLNEEIFNQMLIEVYLD